MIRLIKCKRKENKLNACFLYNNDNNPMIRRLIDISSEDCIKFTADVYVAFDQYSNCKPYSVEFKREDCESIYSRFNHYNKLIEKCFSELLLTLAVINAHPFIR